VFDPLRSATPLDGFLGGFGGKRHNMDYFSFRPAKSPLGRSSPLQTMTPENTPNADITQKRSDTRSFQHKLISSLDRLSMESMPSFATLQGDLDLLSAGEAIPTRILSIYGVQPWISPFDLERVLSVRYLSILLTTKTHGPLNRIVRSVAEQSIVFLFYLDLRLAIKAKASLERTLMHPEASSLSVTYAPPTPLLRMQLGPNASSLVDNSGVLLVRGMERVTAQHIDGYFRQFGEILGSMHLNHGGFAIEFYDIRDCSKARDEANGRVLQVLPLLAFVR